MAVMVEYVNVYRPTVKGVTTKADFESWSKKPLFKGHYRVLREFNGEPEKPMVADDPVSGETKRFNFSEEE